MEDNTKLGLVVIAILLVFVFVGMVCISLKLDLMEDNAKSRYLNTVVVVDINRDRVKEVEKQLMNIKSDILGISHNVLKAEDLLFIEIQLDTILYDQRTLWANVMEQLKIIAENTRQKTFDELMDEAMGITKEGE